MRMRAVLFVAVIAILITAIAGTAVAASSDADHLGNDQLDKLHSERPIAASPSRITSTSILETDVSGALPAAVETAPATPPAPPAPAPAPAPPRPLGTQAFLDCVRWIESRDDYAAHNFEGSGASGAYQFMPGTWNSIARVTGRLDLVGMDPAAASPGDQDAMAAALYEQQGSRPWGGVCS